jgi:hypothetical protein
MHFVLVRPLFVPARWQGTCTGGFSAIKAMTNNTSYCGERAPASNEKMKRCYELQGRHLQAMEGGDDTSGSTPHAYIGKSWRLGRGMGACISARTSSM